MTGILGEVRKTLVMQMKAIPSQKIQHLNIPLKKMYLQDKQILGLERQMEEVTLAYLMIPSPNSIRREAITQITLEE